MPRKPRTSEPEPKPADATKEQPKGTKSGAIRAALKAHSEKGPTEIAELLNAQGWDVTAQRVSVVKSALKAKKKAKKAEPAPQPAAVELPKDAVSIGLLCKAKKLVQELGGIKEAKTALNALAQLLD